MFFLCGIGCFDKMRHVDRFSIDQVYNQLYIIATKVVVISIFAFLYLRKYCDIRGDWLHRIKYMHIFTAIHLKCFLFFFLKKNCVESGKIAQTSCQLSDPPPPLFSFSALQTLAQFAQTPSYICHIWSGTIWYRMCISCPLVFPCPSLRASKLKRKRSWQLNLLKTAKMTKLQLFYA